MSAVRVDRRSGTLEEAVESNSREVSFATREVLIFVLCCGRNDGCHCFASSNFSWAKCRSCTALCCGNKVSRPTTPPFHDYIRGQSGSLDHPGVVAHLGPDCRVGGGAEAIT